MICEPSLKTNVALLYKVFRVFSRRIHPSFKPTYSCTSIRHLKHSITVYHEASDRPCLLLEFVGGFQSVVRVNTLFNCPQLLYILSEHLSLLATMIKSWTCHANLDRIVEFLEVPRKAIALGVIAQNVLRSISQRFHTFLL